MSPKANPQYELYRLKRIETLLAALLNFCGASVPRHAPQRPPSEAELARLLPVLETQVAALCEHVGLPPAVVQERAYHYGKLRGDKK